MSEPLVSERGAAGTLALLLACPSVDIAAAAQAAAQYGLTLLPAGGVGDLAACGLETPLYLVEVTTEGVRAAASWHATLLGSAPLIDPDPIRLLPATWAERHEGAYARARGWLPSMPAERPASDTDEDDDEDLASPVQVFIPVTNLSPLPKADWLFTNELVPKQERRGRRFAPRVPTLVQLPG